jgi:hypothetical protein
VIRCVITPKRTQCVIDTPFAGSLGNVVAEEEEGEDSNLEIFEMQMLDLWESGEKSGNGE